MTATPYISTPYTNALHNAENKRVSAIAKQKESEKLAAQAVELLAEAERWQRAADALRHLFE